MKLRNWRKERWAGAPGEMVLGAVIAIAAFATAFLFARYSLATTFRFYDDEGYILLSLDHYMKGGTLYGNVFSQYGPFYFYVQEALFRLLHQPLTLDGGRTVTLVWWLLSAALAGCFLYQVSRNIVLASAAGLACAKVAWVFAKEPNHPQQVVVPVLLLACSASGLRGRRWLGLLLMGVLGGALLFTKINVGFFYFAALAHLLVCSLPSSPIRKIGVVLLLAYAVACPVLLMRHDLWGWARGYCLLAMLCGGCVFLAGALVMPPSLKPVRDIVCAAAGLLAATALIVVGVSSQGMSLGRLLDGVLWEPLKHPGVFSWPLWVTKWEFLSGVFVSLSLGALYWFRKRGRAGADVVDALRCAIGLSAILFVAIDPGKMVWVLPFLPLAMIPGNATEWRFADFAPRLFVTSLSAAQFLEAYPVAGSQIAIAAQPLLAWAFVCFHDGASGLLRAGYRVAGLRQDFSKKLAIGGLASLMVVAAMVQSGPWPKPLAYPPSRLRGASSLHLRPEEERRYLFLANSIATNCDLLFTLPGLGSLNYWSGVPTPNGWNHNWWVKTFSVERQQEILDILKGNARSCSVYNAEIARFWKATPEDIERSPLARYIIHDMPKVAERDGYQIRVNPGRRKPWIESPRD